MGALTVKEFCREYGICSTFAYQLLKDGILDGRKAGRRTLVSRESAERWYASLKPMHTARQQGTRSHRADLATAA